MVTAAHDRNRARGEDRLNRRADSLVELLHAGTGQRDVAAVDQAPVLADVDAMFQSRRPGILNRGIAARLRPERRARALCEALGIDGGAEEGRPGTDRVKALRVGLDARRTEKRERVWRGPYVPHC